MPAEPDEPTRRPIGDPPPDADAADLDDDSDDDDDDDLDDVDDVDDDDATGSS
jgi:hypothetical protein